MSKYLKLYDKESAYITDLGNNDLYVPNVAFCKDTNNVHYFSPAHESTALCSTTLRDGKIVKVKQLISNSAFAYNWCSGSYDSATHTQKMNSSSASGRIYKELETYQNHIYLSSAKATSSISGTLRLEFSRGWSINNFSINAETEINVIKVVNLTSSTDEYDRANQYFILNGTNYTLYIRNSQLFDLTSMGLSTEAEFRSYLGLADSDDIPYFEYGENEYIALSGKLYKLTYPLWMHYAHETYGIPYANMVSAYSEWSNVQYAFLPNSEGKYGYLNANTSSYIDFGQQYKNVGFPISLDVTSKILSTASKTQYFMGNFQIEGTAQQCFQFGYKAAGNIQIWASPTALTVSNSLSGRHRLKFELPSDSNRKISVDGVTTESSLTNKTIFDASNNYISIFNGGSYDSQGNVETPVGFMDIYLGTNHLCLVPFCRNSVYGMLDLMSNTFFTSATSTGFTYSLE